MKLNSLNFKRILVFTILKDINETFVFPLSCATCTCPKSSCCWK